MILEAIEVVQEAGKYASTMIFMLHFKGVFSSKLNENLSFYIGVAALLLGADPTLTPAEVTSIIINTATRDHIIDAQGSPNLLLYTY